MRGQVIFLGPQRPAPNLTEALASLNGSGPIVSISAGWRHDEGDDAALRTHLGENIVSLPLYRWMEDLDAPDLEAAWHERQVQIREMKAAHRLRLHAALRGVGALVERQGRLGAEAYRSQLQLAIEDVRRIDSQFLEQTRLISTRHPACRRPWADPRVLGRHEEAANLLAEARVVLLTGGHVGVLLNRLRFFGLETVLPAVLERGTHIVGWSAGAMVLTERVVLFYDDPPFGPSFPELFDLGLGIVRGVVALPHARTRLRLDDAQRVTLLTTRLFPAACIGMENGAWLDRRADGTLVNHGPPGTGYRLHADGSIQDLPEAGR